MPTQQDNLLWQEITARIREEWVALAAEEKEWATGHILQIVKKQEQLHQLFLDVDGAEICCQCDGDCCGHGKFHPTLVNLLACLIVNHPLPEPDFSRHCPYIGPDGCLFPPGLRPYNCVSFICEQIECSLEPSRQAEFYRLEKEIRQAYELFADRYVGAGMRGILIRGAILPTYLSRR